MAVKASTTVTITAYRDTLSVTRYYKLVSATASAPSKPTANPPDGWTDTEPSYTSDSTDILYFCDLTIFSNEEWEYSAVSQSSAYEAAKEAYTKAQNAQTTANNAQTGVDSLNDTVFGVQTFEYVLDGVTIPAHKREDGTYYYILNDAEVDVAEANLVHDADGELTSYQEGGIYESLNGMSDNIRAIDTKVNSFDARETAIYNAIQDNSLIARKNARVEGNSLIITNDTATEDIASLLNYLQLNADSIVIYGNGKDIVTIAKTADDSGYMKMNGTSMLQAQESKFSTIRLRSADGTGNLALVAGSDGHVSLREVL